MDTSVAISGVVLIPLVIGLIQFAKRFAPGAPGNVWLAASMVLAVFGQVVVQLVAVGAPNDLASWVSLVVVGLAFGLATSKAYDETVGVSDGAD